MRSLGKNTPFLAFPEAKKGVVNYASLRKATHWPNNNTNPSGLSEKKVYCVERRDMCDPLEKTPFLAFPEAIKGVVNYASLRKATHWPNNNANPSGLSEKKVYCVERCDMCEP